MVLYTDRGLACYDELTRIPVSCADRLAYPTSLKSSFHVAYRPTTPLKLRRKFYKPMATRL